MNNHKTHLFKREYIFKCFFNTITTHGGNGKFYPPSLVKIITKGQEGFKY